MIQSELNIFTTKHQIVKNTSLPVSIYLPHFSPSFTLCYNCHVSFSWVVYNHLTGCNLHIKLGGMYVILTHLLACSLFSCYAKKAIRDYIECLSRIFMYLAKIIPDLSYSNTQVLGIDFKYMD